MNFIGAIQHATIGYGIRRKAWFNRTLYLTGDGHNIGPALYWVESAADECKLLGPDQTLDLSAEDIQAQDWEAI